MLIVLHITIVAATPMLFQSLGINYIKFTTKLHNILFSLFSQRWSSFLYLQLKFSPDLFHRKSSIGFQVEINKRYFTLFQVLFSFESNFTQNGAKTFSSSSLIHLLAEFGPITLTIKNHFICNVNALVFSAAVSNCPCWGRKNKYCKLGKDQLFGG